MSRSRILIGIVVVLVLSGVGYGAYRQYGAPVESATVTPASSSTVPFVQSVVSAEGKVLPAREATLAFRASGRVEVILVAEGQAVREGDPLIRLWAADLEAAVAQAEAALALAEANRDAVAAGARAEEIRAAEQRVSAATAASSQAASQLAQLQSGATADLIAAARANVAQAEAAQKQAQIAYDRIQENIQFLAGATEEQGRFNLHAANEALSAAQAGLNQLLAGADANAVKAAQAAVWAAGADRESAKAQLELLEAGASEHQIAAAEAQVAQAQAALGAARAALEQATLTAPFAGTVAQINAEVGEVVVPGAPLIQLADLSRWTMDTDDLAETDVVLIAPGQTAAVSLDAFPGQTFAGTVTGIASVSEVNRGNVTYRVTIELDPTDAALRWGMTAFADIDVKER